MSDHPHIIIGSSPIALIEALWLSNSGKKVLILEGADKIGGAWRTVEVPPHGEIEIGCHIWDVDREVCRFLENYLGLDLGYLSPSPRMHKGGRSFPYDWKNNVFMMKRTLKHTFGLRFDQIRKDFGKNSPFRWSFLPSQYPYPKGGSAALMDAITRKVDENERIQIRTGKKVDRLSIDGKEITITSGDEIHKTTNVTMTQYIRIDEIEINGRIIDQKPDIREFCHLHLVINDSKRDTFSYLRLLTDPFIHRLSDVTHQVEGSDERIILAGIHAKTFHSNSEEAIRDHVMRWLRSKRLVASDAICSKHISNSYTCAYMDATTYSMLRSQEGVRVLRSVNFIHGMKGRLPDWRELIATS